MKIRDNFQIQSGFLFNKITFAFCCFMSLCFSPGSSAQMPLSDTNEILQIRDQAKIWKSENRDSAIFYYRLAGNKVNGLLLLSQSPIQDIKYTQRLKELSSRTNIDLGNELFWKGDYKGALVKYKLALELAQEIDDISLEGECYGEMATMYRNLGDHTQALQSNKKALEIADVIQDNYWKGILYNNRGVILQAIGDYPGALKSFFRAIDLYDDIPDSYPNVEILNIGRIYELQGDLDQALEYYFQSLEITKEHQTQKFRVAECYLVIGGIYLKKKETEKARDYFTDALNLLLEGGHHYRTDICYSQIGETHLLENEPNKAIEFFNKALKISRDKNEVNTEGEILLRLANANLQVNNISVAQDYTHKALEIAVTTGYLELKRDAYSQLTNIYEQLGNYKTANEFQNLNNEVKDSLFNNQKVRALADMKTKYETERTEIELSLVEEQKNTAEQKLRNNRITYIAIIIVLALASLFTFISFYFLRQRSRLKLQAFRQKQMRLKREFEQKKNALQILTLKNQLNPHFIFNALNSIGSSILKEKKTKAYDLLTNFSDLIRSSLDQSDKISVTLKQELEFVNNYLVLEKNRFRDIFDYRINIAKDVDKKAKIPRMAIQVFVENAIKHGLRYKENDGLLKIDIEQKELNVHITISDNGIGRKKAGTMPSSSTGRGLAIIREMFKIYEQLHNIQIGYDIHDKYSKDGSPEGTEVQLTIPII